MPDKFSGPLRVAILSFYMACIYLSLGSVRAVSSALRNAGLLGRVTGTLVVGSAAVLVLFGLRRCRNRNILFAVAALMLAAAWFIGFPEERLHLLEYGGAGWMCAWVFSGRSGGWAWALVLVYLLGLCDEVIQCFLPCRVYDDRDVVLNFAAGVAGIVLFAQFRGSTASEGRLTGNYD